MRTGVFFDSQNLFYSAESFKEKGRVDYKRLIELIRSTDDADISICTAYLIRKDSINQDSFKSVLRSLRVEVKEKVLKKYDERIVRSDWDTGICVDVMANLHNLDRVVLVSGDGDFIPLMDYVLSQKKEFYLFAFEGSCNNYMIRNATRFVSLNEEILFNPEEHRRKED